MKKPEKYYLTSNPKEAKFTLVMRATNRPDIPEQLLAYANCFNCREEVVYSSLNKKAAKLAKLCNECFEKYSGMTVQDLVNQNPEEAEKSLQKLIKSLEKVVNYARL